MVELIEIAPGKWRIKRAILVPPRSDLPTPMVISDTMDPVEQVDGQFYTSKRQYRAVGRAHGLIEIGNEKLPVKPKGTGALAPAAKKARREALGRAIQRVRT